MKSIKSVYPVAMNSLGEMICLGCGSHYPNLTIGRGRTQAFCSPTCRSRVHEKGGRLTRSAVRERIAAMG